MEFFNKKLNKKKKPTAFSGTIVGCNLKKNVNIRRGVSKRLNVTN